MNGTIAYALSRKYIEQSLDGVGALKGKNATISSITTINGGSQITFAYTLDDGTQQTSTLDVFDAYGIALKNGFVGTEEEWLASLKGETGDTEQIETLVEEKVQEQIETQLDDTIQEKVDKAVEEALSGGSGEGSDSSVDDEINSWF